MAKKKAYISGRISGLPQEAYERNFQNAEDYVESLGMYEVVNPLKVRPCETEDCAPRSSLKEDGTFLHDYKCYMIHDVKAMLDCDIVFMMPDWSLSGGASKERVIAKLLGIEVAYIEGEFS